MTAATITIVHRQSKRSGQVDRHFIEKARSMGQLERLQRLLFVFGEAPPGHGRKLADQDCWRNQNDGLAAVYDPHLI